MAAQPQLGLLPIQRCRNRACDPDRHVDARAILASPDFDNS